MARIQGKAGVRVVCDWSRGLYETGSVLYTLNKTQDWKIFIQDVRRITPHPLINQRSIDAPEIHLIDQITFVKTLQIWRAVKEAGLFEFLSKNKDIVRGAVIGSSAGILTHSSSKF